MKHTIESERIKYDAVWRDPRYRLACHSRALWHDQRDLFPEFESALDIGCGLGLLIDEWVRMDIDAWGVDISPGCISHDLHNKQRVVFGCLWEMEWDRRFDFGVCTDVMEHVPPDYVDETLRRIAICCDYILFKIAHSTSEFIGQTLHLTLKPQQWWVAQMDNITGKGSAKFVGTQERSGFQDSLIRWIPVFGD